jgi:hypothetical protein
VSYCWRFKDAQGKLALLLNIVKKSKATMVSLFSHYKIYYSNF